MSSLDRSDLTVLEAIKVMRRYYRWKRDLVAPHLGDTVVEVGCGTGLMLEQLKARHLVGVDHDAECLAKARNRLAGRENVRLECLDMLSPAFLGLSSLGADTVLFANCLEVSADGGLALRQGASILRPGGNLVLLVSAMPSLSSELDRFFGQRRYGKAEVVHLLEEAGLRMITSHYVNMLGAIGWLWDSRVAEKNFNDVTTYRRRDLLVPLARLLDLLTGPPFGRSLLAVARKP